MVLRSTSGMRKNTYTETRYMIRSNTNTINHNSNKECTHLS